MEPIVISNPSSFKGESSLINRLFEAGLEVFHLRKPGMDSVAYKKLIEEIDPVYHPRLAIHQFHELREGCAIARLHFTAQHRKAVVREDLLLNVSAVRSTSIHDLSEFTDLNGFSYTFFGPLFNSLSKPGYLGVVKSGFRWEAICGQPKLIALGGIDSTNLLQVRQMGFEGAAVLGALWNEPSKALETFKNLRELWMQTDLM